MRLSNWMRPEVRRSYPHMAALDASVWTEFLRQHGGRYDGVLYDLKVGGWPVGVSASDPSEAELLDGMYLKRIDAVLRVGRDLAVVEVKPYGNYVSLGQVLVYESKFRARYEWEGSVGKMVVCGMVDPDLVGEFAAHAVEVYEVGAEWAALG